MSQDNKREPVKVLLRKQRKKKSSFLNFLCPCLCGKESDAESPRIKKPKKSDDTSISTRKDDVLQEEHEDTQYSLPVGIRKHSSVQEYEIKKHEYISQSEQQSPTKHENAKITFNVKRNSLFQPYLKQFNRPGQDNSKNYLGVQNNRLKSRGQITSTSCNTRQNFSKRQSENSNQGKFDFQQKKTLYKPRQSILQKLYNNSKLTQKERQDLLKLEYMHNGQYQDFQFIQNWQQTYENHYPINQLKENKIMLIGDRHGRLLSKVSTVKLYPSYYAMQRYKESMKTQKLNKKLGIEQPKFNNELDRYWEKRYFLFQKFDEGIKLDQQSWYSVTPEAVAEYLSTKVNVSGTILDAFCGSGGDSIKLSASCQKIVCNDIDPVKLECLINNAHIYDVTNLQITNCDFFNIDSKCDAVYLAPPWGGPDYHEIKSFHPQQFEPPLSKIFQKSLSLSKNLFFLLPANTDVQSLASILAQKIRQTKSIISQSCTLKLEKVYFNDRLKFIAGFYGDSSVQSQVQLNEQLKFIYTIAREDEDEGIFKYKKIMRKIREQYGMVNLLNFIFECENYFVKDEKTQPVIQSIPLIEKFYAYLLDKNLISAETLQKIKEQQQIQYQYELKNRQQRNKRQKKKKIMKKYKRHPSSDVFPEQIINQKQCLQKFTNFIDEGIEKQKFRNSNQNNQSQQNEQECQIYRINLRKTDKSSQKHSNSHQNLQSSRGHSSNIVSRENLGQTQTSHISRISEDHNARERDSQRTVSYISQFPEQELANIRKNDNYSRYRTNSEASLVDSIHPIRKADDIQISIDLGEEYHVDQKLQSSEHKYSEKHIPEKLRFSSPIYHSPRDNYKMKKNKMGSNWQKGIVQEVNQEKEADN